MEITSSSPEMLATLICFRSCSTFAVNGIMAAIYYYRVATAVTVKDRLTRRTVDVGVARRAVDPGVGSDLTLSLAPVTIASLPVREYDENCLTVCQTDFERSRQLLARVSIAREKYLDDDYYLQRNTPPA